MTDHAIERAVATHGLPETVGFYRWPPDESVGWEPAPGPDRRPGTNTDSIELHYDPGAEGSAEAFRLASEFAYYDGDDSRIYVVPARPGEFETDLTSVPQLVSWFVPPLGRHLRAALLHDALVIGSPRDRPRSISLDWIRLIVSFTSLMSATWMLLIPGSGVGALLSGIVFVVAVAESPPDRPIAEGMTHLGEPVSRPTADRIFRDAMALDGTKLLRRWLMWSAVTAATRWESPLTSRARQLLGRLLVLATFGGVIVLGVIATADLLDISENVSLPWMGDLVWWRELVQGLAAAVLVPIGLSIGWRGQHRAAILGGMALALLVHVTLAILVVYGIYLLFEDTTDRLHRRWFG